MTVNRSSHFMIAAIMAAALTFPAAMTYAEKEEKDAHPGHREVQGVVVEKAGALSVKTPDGATYQLNEGRSRRHGHEPPKVGDEVTVVLDENNLVSEIHPKGSKMAHRYVTGKLIYVGKMKPEIKLKTAKGEEIFPLEKQVVKTVPIEEGAMVTVELNEAGSVIDLHRADSAAEKH
jgi:hypothetical protein